QGLSDLDKREYLRQSLYYLVMHEMGHTMGLMHNMKATQLWNPVQAHDKKLTQAIGLVGSVMDYPAANIALDKTKQGDYFTTRPGPYDLWAIEYGYSEGLEDEQKERERLQKILSRSADSTLMFGNDADDMRSSSNGIDPRVNVNDFSNDAITYSVDRIRLINQTLPKLKEKYIKEGSTYQELVQAYSISMGEWFNAATTVTRYVGGVYVDRAVAGQKGATRPLTPVDLKDQKRAMAALNTYIFSPNAFAAPADLYQYLQVQRRGFNFFGTNEDPKLHDRFVIMQINALAHLTNGKVLKRMTDSRLYGNKYSVYDMFSDLTEYCFRDDMAGTVNTIRQNLQLEYTRRLITVAGIQEGSNSNFDPISKSAAMSQLKKIRGLMAIALVTSTGETKAHREHVALLIDKAFAK
ncbi:MAG: zinc-dependent metalloprotease, partial [Bacteroidia bacterium]|nr:zinc-dependent metalloprotease [Bacteroidia bacterium]